MSTSANQLPVLFLDFDGVTHPEPCYQEDVFCRLHLIETVLLELTAVAIVISSSWRDQYPLDELRGFFCEALRPRVVGVTPSIKNPSSDWLPGHVPQFERQWEIETWMKANRPWGTPWLAIDDRAHWFMPDCPNLLLTDSLEAFRPEHQAPLRAMLQERLA